MPDPGCSPNLNTMMINRSKFETLIRLVLPDGLSPTEDDFGLEWLNANHTNVEQLAIECFVPTRFKNRVTAFEIAVMEPEVRSRLSHHKLPSAEEEVVAFDRLMDSIGLPFHHGTQWTSIEPHVTTYSQYAYSHGGKNRRAYTSQEGVFAIWRFTDDRFSSLCVCDIETVRQLQNDPEKPDCDAEDELPYGTFAEFTEFMSESGGGFERSTIH